MMLILGGTKMARLLAEHLGSKYNVIYSIAGATERAKLPKFCSQISGGFGGAKGLESYIKANGINICIDATHPFAQIISQNAIIACEGAQIPIVQFARRAWNVEGASEFNNEQELIKSLPDDAKIFLTIGGQNIVPYLGLTQNTLARMIEPPKLNGSKLPDNFEILLSRPPYNLDDEIALMREQNISHLICKNSGGHNLAAKLIAAQQLGIKILMLKQPKSPHEVQFFSIEEIETYLNKRSLVSPS